MTPNSGAEKVSNLKFGALRSVVERAFGMLKVRWRIALKKVGQKTSILKKTMIAT